MSISTIVTEDLKAAMKAKDKLALEALRAVKTAFTLAKTEKGVGTELAEAEELKIVQKLIKQRKDSAAVYKEQDRNDLYEKEIAEAAIIEKYLPEQLSDEELEVAIKAIIEKVGAESMKDMGKVMGMASKELGGKADGKSISVKVKALLS
jgi:uncharacterized protein YqeY